MKRRLSREITVFWRLWILVSLLKSENLYIIYKKPILTIVLHYSLTYFRSHIDHPSKEFYMKYTSTSSFPYCDVLCSKLRWRNVMNFQTGLLYFNYFSFYHAAQHLKPSPLHPTHSMPKTCFSQINRGRRSIKEKKDSRKGRELVFKYSTGLQ